MLQTRRSAIRLAKRLRNQPPRRLESNHSSRHSEHAHEAHHHAGPVNEHFGVCLRIPFCPDANSRYYQRGFYLSIASIPVAYVLYAFTTNNPDAPPLFTRIINSYSQYEERWVQRNALHTAMIEQAAFDRNLFQGSERSQMIDLKFPEYIPSATTCYGPS